jgi:hypothetical protein
MTAGPDNASHELRPHQDHAAIEAHQDGGSFVTFLARDQTWPTRSNTSADLITPKQAAEVIHYLKNRRARQCGVVQGLPAREFISASSGTTSIDYVERELVAAT